MKEILLPMQYSSIHSDHSLFFFSHQPHLSLPTKVYLYQVGGMKKIVGEGMIDHLFEIPDSKIGTYGMLPYYVKHVKKDEKLYDQIMEIYEMKTEEYDDSIKLYYLFWKEGFQRHILENKGLTMEEMEISQTCRDKSMKLCFECDRWLMDLGFYDVYGESQRTHFVEIKDKILYETPISLSDFQKESGEKIRRVSHWMYVQKRVL